MGANIIPISDPSNPIATGLGWNDFFLTDVVDNTQVTGYKTRKTRLAQFLPYVNIMAFGADPTGVADCSAALAAAIATLPTNGGTIFFPVGNFYFASNFFYTLANAPAAISFIGCGADISILTFASGCGMGFTYRSFYNSTHFRDLTFATRGVGTATAVELLQTGTTTSPAIAPQSDFTNVVFRGSDGYVVTNYWSTCINVILVADVICNNVVFSGPNPTSGGYTTVGTGFSVSSGPNSNASVTMTAGSPGVVNDTAHGMAAGQAVQFIGSGTLPTGVTYATIYYVLNPTTNAYNLSATPLGAAINFTGSPSGTNIRETVPPIAPINCQFINCLFNYVDIGINYGNYAQGILVTQCNFTGGSYGVFVGANLIGLSELSVCNNQFNVGTAAIQTGTPVLNFTFIGNTVFLTSGGIGLNMGYAAFSTITANTFQSAANVGRGIVLATASGGFGNVISANMFSALLSGILIQNAYNWQTIVCDNFFTDCATVISNAGLNVVIHDNLGYNPVGASSIASPPASGGTYTAGASPETIYMSASTGITAVSQNGVAILPAALGNNVMGTFQLGPNETLVPTYTGTLTMKKMVH